MANIIEKPTEALFGYVTVLVRLLRRLNLDLGSIAWRLLGV